MTFLRDRVYDVRTADEKAAKKVPLTYMGKFSKIRIPSVTFSQTQKGPDSPISTAISAI